MLAGAASDEPRQGKMKALNIVRDVNGIVEEDAPEEVERLNQKKGERNRWKYLDRCSSRRSLYIGSVRATSGQVWIVA